jgi:PadR family transcriptional regulator, regulatory protein PadR
MNKTKDKKSELLPGTLEMLILKTLERGGVMHGFGIAQHIKQISEEVLQVEEGSLYPALQRMQLKGWLASDWGHSANNRRARYYRLTATGRKQIQQEIAEFDRLLKAIQLVLQTT